MAEKDAHFTPIIIAKPDPLLGTLDNIRVVLQWKEEKILPDNKQIGAVIKQMDETKDNCICIELYDSSTTCHISPY